MKIKLAFIAVALVSSFCYAAEPRSSGDEPLSFLLPANPLEGSRLFTGKGCFRCHAIHGVGGAAGPDLGQGLLKRPLLEIAGIMWNHSPGMAYLFEQQGAKPPQLKPTEMASLLSFLYYLGSLDPPGNAARGERLFREKRCQSCHSLGGKGDRRAPKLDNYSRYASPVYLATGLWNHGKAMAAFMESLGVLRPTFEPNDIPDLLAYIRSAGENMEHVYVQPGNPQHGQKLFSEKRCIQCHSIAGRGEGIGPNLRAKLKGSLMAISGAMWNHGPKMWAKMAERGIQMPSLTTEEMSDLISYLYFLQFIDSPGDPQRGRIVYEEKRCGACHTLPGATGIVGPELSKVEKLKTPIAVVTEMWNHASTMERKMLEQTVEWPVFKGAQMPDLVAYLLSLRKGADVPVAQKKSAGGNR